MNKTRLEAFSDGVLAIIITIMVLEIKVPHEASFESLFSIAAVFVSYVLSFIYVGIYWNNHHHLLHSLETVDGKILWANLHLLFWLSLIPFATGWMGENNFAGPTLAVYGFVLFMSAIAFWILKNKIISIQGDKSILKKAVRSDVKGKVSPLLYLIGIGFSFYSQWISGAIYIFVALMWLIPDTRIEKIIKEKEEEKE